MSVAPGFKEWASRRAPNPAGPGMGWARGVWELAKDAYGAGFRYHQADLLAKAERCEAAEQSEREAWASSKEQSQIAVELFDEVQAEKLAKRELRARIAELESERDAARRAAEHYRDGYDDAGPELKVLASNRFPWETSHD